VSWAAKVRNWRRDKPPIREILAAHAAGEDRLPELARFHRERPEELESCLVEMLASVTGGTRERLSRLAAGLGLVNRWQEQARSPDPKVRAQALARLTDLPWGVADSTVMMALVDQEEPVRTQALRALLRSGGRRDVERVFTLAISERPAIRSVLAPELAPHALTLAETAIPAVLRSENAENIAAALELIEGWGKGLPLPDLPPLLVHAESVIRARALRALPYTSSVRSLDAGVLRALRDESAEVRAAACLAAARLQLEPALPAVIECLREPEPGVARDAALALAEFGQAGLAALEREVRLGWSPAMAAAALEAVESLRNECYGYARL
jgi:HEAT repeat protein